MAFCRMLPSMNSQPGPKLKDLDIIPLIQISEIRVENLEGFHGILREISMLKKVQENNFFVFPDRHLIEFSIQLHICHISLNNSHTNVSLSMFIHVWW